MIVLRDGESVEIELGTLYIRACLDCGATFRGGNWEEVRLSMESHECEESFR